MRNCPNCNNGVNETASKCPHCGVTLNFNTGKELSKEKTKVENTQQDKQTSFPGWIIGVICIAVIFLLGLNLKPMQQISGGNHISAPALTGMDGINYGFTAIPENIVGYLKTSAQYSQYYNFNKKFGIYFTGPNCPYAQIFDSAMNPIMNDYNYQQYYNFMAIDMNQGIQRFSTREEAQNDIDFNRLCKEFCIVNPAKKAIFYIDGVGEAEAAKLSYIFESLKTW